MKKSPAFLMPLFAACFFAWNASASALDSFFFEPFFTAEYSAVDVSSGGVNSDFKTDSFEVQLKNFDNIALGGHFRIHKFIGLNANWSQTSLYSDKGLQDYSVSLKPRFQMSYYNFSALFFAPIVEDSLFELFAELGVSDMNSSLTIFSSDGTFSKLQDHQTNGFYGAGFQLAPFEESKNAFRFSVNRYIDKIALLDTDLTVFRLGYVMRF